MATILLIIVAASSSASAESADEIQGIIDQAKQHNHRRIELPAGEHRIDQTLDFDGLENLVVEGNGAKLVFTRFVHGLNIFNCRNVVFRNFILDHDPLPFTQGEVIAKAPDDKRIEVRLHEGYPRFAFLNQHEEGPYWAFTYLADSRLLKPGVLHVRLTATRDLDGDRAEIVANAPVGRMIEVGDLVAMPLRLNRHPVRITRDRGGIVFQNVTVHSAAGLAFNSRAGEGGTVLRNVTIERGPRPKGATEDRLLSTNLDVLNFAELRKGPIIENCDWGFMGDDAINVQGDVLQVGHVVSSSEFWTRKPYGPRPSDSMRPGDTVRLLDPDDGWRVVGRPKIKSIETTREPPADIKQRLDKRYKRNVFYSRVVLAQPSETLNDELHFDVPEVACPGFIIRNNYFHDHIANALRIQAVSGLIENNRIERSKMQAICMIGQYHSWHEAGWNENIIVRNNRLKDIGMGNLFITAAIAVKGPGSADHQLIIIENNNIDGCSEAGIHVKSARNVIVRNNQIANVCRRIADDPVEYPYGILVEESARDILLENNRIIDPGPDCKAKIQIDQSARMSPGPH